MAYEALLYEKKNRVAYITLNRPEALNAWNNQLNEETFVAFQQADSDDDVYVIVLTGTGRGFQVGADMKEAARGDRVRPEGRGGLQAVATARKPIVCAVNGICAGAGLILIGDCDVTICADDAIFFDPHVDVGWLPLGETFATATHIPFGIAMRMALMGNAERMSAERAYQVGLVSEVVAHDKLMERATEIAEVIAAKAPLATRWVRQAMRHIIIDTPHKAAMEEMNRWVHMQVNHSPDGIEGPRSFAQKRKAQWTGEGGPVARSAQRG